MYPGRTFAASFLAKTVVAPRQAMSASATTEDTAVGMAAVVTGAVKGEGVKAVVALEPS